MIVTAKLLTEVNACEDQVATFAQEWPGGMKVNRENLFRAVELDLDIGWGADEFLRGEALKAYNKATAEATKAYHEAIAEALKAYNKATAEPYKAYDEALVEPWKAYNEALVKAILLAVASDPPNTKEQSG